MTNAGFNRESFPRLNDVILVTEPEAAAVYTARYLKEVSVGADRLKVGTCIMNEGNGSHL